MYIKYKIHFDLLKWPDGATNSKYNQINLQYQQLHASLYLNSNKKGKRYMAYLRGSDLTSTTATPTITGLFTNQMRLIYQINQLDAKPVRDSGSAGE